MVNGWMDRWAGPGRGKRRSQGTKYEAAYANGTSSCPVEGYMAASGSLLKSEWLLFFEYLPCAMHITYYLI